MFWIKVLKKVCNISGLKFFNSLRSQRDNSPEEHVRTINKAEWDVYFDGHGDLKHIQLDKIDFTAIHSTRNPAHLILSSVNYHQKSRDSWLHKPHDKIDRLTYQQFISSLDTLEGKILFEIENASGNNIRKMISLSTDPRFINVDLDLISSDFNMNISRNLYYMLYLEDMGIPVRLWMKTVRSNSLWYDNDAVGCHKNTSILEKKESPINSFGEKSRNAFKKAFEDKLFYSTFIEVIR